MRSSRGIKAGMTDLEMSFARCRQSGARWPRLRAPTPGPKLNEDVHMARRGREGIANGKQAATHASAGSRFTIASDVNGQGHTSKKISKFMCVLFIGTYIGCAPACEPELETDSAPSGTVLLGACDDNNIRERNRGMHDYREGFNYEGNMKHQRLNSRVVGSGYRRRKDARPIPMVVGPGQKTKS
jgi:hypothetical protein